LARTVFRPTNAHTRLIGVEVDGTSAGCEELRHFREIAIGRRIILPGIDPKVAIGSTEYVLFLRYRAFDVCTPRYIGIRHVEDSKTGPELVSQGASNLAPISGKHLDAQSQLSRTALRPPALEVLRREAMIEAGWPGALERFDRLLEDVPAA
jgi:hypothetical protein